MNYKNNFKVLVSALVLGALILPIASFARPFATSTPKANKVGNNFCVNITDKLTQQNQNLSEQLAKFEIKKAEQLKKISENRLNVDEKRLSIRARVDANRDERISKLEARATTSDQKIAVTAFRTTLASITETHRLAVDEAVKAYRENVDQALSLRKTANETARTAFKAAVDGLLAKAKTDCDNGVDIQVIRRNINEGIKAAREEFRQAVQGIDKAKVTVNSSTETRKMAVTRAQEEFRAAYEKAIADLRDAFKN